jgi:hypothetical protein
MANLYKEDNTKSDIIMNYEEWAHEFSAKLPGLSDEQRSQVFDALKQEFPDANKQIQILGGNQNIGHQQFIFQDESVEKLSKVLEVLASSIKKEFGAEVGAEIIKSAIMAFANVLSK